jgi:hypothetical protein
VDRNFYKAFNDGGPLRWTNNIATIKAEMLDRKLRRACLLSDGTQSQVMGFDLDALNTSRRYIDQGDITKLITTAEYLDLQYLACLCSRNKLRVIHPSALPSTDPPVLTLDRACLLAVYVGRQACGEPGRDIDMFRPTSDVVEETVDVSIITQLITPTLEQRAADGTAVFESFGDQNRLVKDPHEIVVLCVDASASMQDRSGFIDIEENEDANDLVDKDAGPQDPGDDEEDLRLDRPALDELKEYLSSHESFDDFLAITQSGIGDINQQQNAKKVLRCLCDLIDMQIKEKTKFLHDEQRRATTFYLRQKSNTVERELATLKNRVSRFRHYEEYVTPRNSLI